MKIVGGGIFSIIEIETINRCNGLCSFCPVNAKQPQREYARMTEELFKKIINELSEINYSGAISLFSNNEPFLDERIFDFHKYANEMLPKAFFNLFTNGTLLTFEKFLDIIPYVDWLVIDNYNDNFELNTQDLKKIYEYVEQHSELKKPAMEIYPRVSFAFRRQNEVLTSRAGQSPNKKGRADKYVQKLICKLPFISIVVRPTGKVSLCCNDALGQMTLGDINKQSLQEVWYSEEFKKIRKEMLANGRKNLPLCKDCDTFDPIHEYVRHRD